MKTERDFKKVVVSPKGERWLQTGHPWVYETDVIGSDENIENASIVDVRTENGKYLGSGFFSEHSKIRVRILSKNANDTYQ